MEKDLTKGRPFRTILGFALPVMGGNLFQLLYTLADTVIVGRTMGADALAAVGATGTAIYFILCFIQGLTGGFGICLGQRYGAKDETGMRQSIAASWILSAGAAVVITIGSCLLVHPILNGLQTPERIYAMAYEYLLVMLLGTGATMFYNMISNILRALGDSRTPLYLLVVSSVLNIVLDIVLIVPLNMGVGGAAWATVLAQLISAVLCTAVGLARFPVMRLTLEEWQQGRTVLIRQLAVGLPMGFQMSVMCIGLLAVQAVVNGMGPETIAGFTAATKINQLPELINAAFGIAVSNYVAQNYGAVRYDRIREGVRACLLQLETLNILVGALMLLGRDLVVPLFLDAPTQEIVSYANRFLLAQVPFYVLLGMIHVYRSSTQSIGNGLIPFLACVIELVMRTAAALGLAHIWGYTGVCFATPMAWIGAAVLLIPAFYATMSNREAEHHYTRYRSAK